MVTVAQPAVVGTALMLIIEKFVDVGAAPSVICGTAWVVFVPGPGGDQARQSWRVVEAP